MYYWPIHPYKPSWMAKLFSPFVYYNVAVCLFCSVCSTVSDAAQKMKFSVKDFFSKCEQIHSFLCALLFIGTAQCVISSKFAMSMQNIVAPTETFTPECIATLLKKNLQRRNFLVNLRIFQNTFLPESFPVAASGETPQITR